MNLIFLAALTRNRVIGKDRAVPWDLPEDMQRFMKLTMGHVVLMGRGTYDTLSRPLKNRRNVVITTHPLEGVETYPTLAEAVKSQSVFEFDNIQGTMICFRIPSYIGSLNVPGYHCHFLSDDRRAGGHLLDCRINTASAVIDDTGTFYMDIPMDKELDSANLSPSGNTDAEK